jgi:hypothetical protein
VELPIADVESDHPCSAPLEEDVGEAAGRGSDIDAIEAGRVDAEPIEPVRELLPSARDVRRQALDLELGVLRNLLARLVVAAHKPGEDESLRLRPRPGQAALDEKDVEALLQAPECGRRSLGPMRTR